MFEKILAGYAGDRAGRDAVALAVRLAALQDGSLTIAFPYHPLLASVTADGALERVRGELTAMLGEGESRLQDATYRWSPSSWPIRALQELAAYEGSSVIVVGAAPERVERRHIGLMERLVHGCPCAVAVAPEGFADRETNPLRRIGVGFADSREGRAAIGAGIDLARATGGRLRVIAGAGLGAAIAGYGFASSALPEIEQELYEQTGRTLAAVLDGFDGGLEAEREVRRGDPAEVLVEASAGLDLMILGSRAYGPARRALLGSVSADVMRRSHCPVLVLPRCSCACAPRDASTAGSDA